MGRTTALPQVRLLFPPLLLVDEGEVFSDGVLPLLQFFICEKMLIDSVTILPAFLIA